MSRSPEPVPCQLCRGVCPECGGHVGDAAGSLKWVLCSMCHATFRHTHDDEKKKPN